MQTAENPANSSCNQGIKLNNQTDETIKNDKTSNRRNTIVDVDRIIWASGLWSIHLNSV
jgi:hypothetical protein